MLVIVIGFRRTAGFTAPRQLRSVGDLEGRSFYDTRTIVCHAGRDSTRDSKVVWVAAVKYLKRLHAFKNVR